MNLIPKIAQMLGVEIGEEFKLKQTSGDIKSAKYRFRNIGDQIIYERTDFCGGWTMCSAEEVGLLVLGKHEIVKLPFKPEEGEWYCMFMFCGDDFCVANTEFSNYDIKDLTNAYCGNCFRNKDEANNHKAEIYEKLTGKKWEE